MANGYWSRQASMHPPSAILKRHRSDHDLPPEISSGHELHKYLGQDDERGGVRALKDSKSIGSAYDHYIQSVQLAPLTSGEASNFGGIGLGRIVGGERPDPSIAESAVMGRSGGVGLDLASNNTISMGFGGKLPVDAVTMLGRETAPLPQDATNTLYVEGFPPDSTKREVAHIFRPFVGYREVRLVTKESKHRGGYPLILCFVDFMNQACAATALSALQGYKMDENDIDSPFLRLQFSRFPSPRFAPGNRGQRCYQGLTKSWLERRYSIFDIALHMYIFVFDYYLDVGLWHFVSYDI